MRWLVQIDQNDEIVFEIIYFLKEDAEQYRKRMLVNKLNLFMNTYKLKEDDLEVGIVETVLQAFLDKNLNENLKSYKVPITEVGDDFMFPPGILKVIKNGYSDDQKWFLRTTDLDGTLLCDEFHRNFGEDMTCEKNDILYKEIQYYELPTNEKGWLRNFKYGHCSISTNEQQIE